MSQDPIRNVSDTALWVAMYRAFESERRDALFHDPFARRLAGERGEAIVRSMPRGRAMGWPMVVRTALIDELVTRSIANGTDTVINLAAGLDARPWRLDLPAELRWFDVDLEPMLAYKREGIGDAAPHCRYEALGADLRDAAARAAVFEWASAGARRTLVISEGLLVYLEPEQVSALAHDLARPPSFREWIIDIASPQLLVWLRRSWGRNLDRADASFKFAPSEGTAFFEPYGWKEREFRATFDEAHRLRRDMPFGWFWRFLGRFASAEKREGFRRYSGIVLLERNAPGA